ncbi:COG4223 family protein [Aquamicrobium soli]|uniref:COG4223 family protein n=1 Tax=Aquamicrobium soli TaxID=1811518 RepID=A0ABV7KBT2_9HYPH
MVKTPKTRHSKSQREPVTIELGPGEVSRVTDPQADEAEAAASESPEAVVQGEETPAADEARAEAEKSEETAAPAQEPPAASSAFDDLPPRPAADGDEDGRAPADLPRPERGGLGPIAAGLAGGLIVLAGAAGLHYAGFLGGSTASLDSVNSRISALKTQMDTLSNTEKGGEAMARVKMLSDALEQVKTDVGALKTGQADAAQALGELRDKMAAVETGVSGLQKDGGPSAADLAPLNDKLAALDGQIKGVADAADERQARLGALEQSVSSLSAKVEAQASQPKIALSIAAAALKAALDRGGPFSSELETFAAVAPDAPQLAVLRPYAEKGVPIRAAIASGVAAAASAMIDAATPVDENAGFFQSLMASAEKLVKVRPVGAVSGSGVPETVARLEAAVEEGDYARAIAEYDSLPDAVKAAGADFAGQLKARLDVEAAIDALVADAMKA